MTAGELRAQRNVTRAEHGRSSSVLAALDVLEILAEADVLGVTQVARRLSVAKSTAHRLLSSLCARGLAEQVPETGQYRLGLRLYELGQLAQDRILLRHVALPVLEELRLMSGLVAHLSIADGAEIVFLERMHTLSGLRLLGERPRRMPLHTTSSGKAIAAFDSAADRACVAHGLPAMTEHTISTRSGWARALDEVRRQGYAVADGENRVGLASVAAPIRDTDGRARAAVSLAGPSELVLANVDRFARLVVAAAGKIGPKLVW